MVSVYIHAIHTTTQACSTQSSSTVRWACCAPRKSPQASSTSPTYADRSRHTSTFYQPSTQAHCGEASVDQQVEEKINTYLTWLERNPTKQGQLLLSFYETRRKQAWFAAHEERLYWEQWWVIGANQRNHGMPVTVMVLLLRCIPLSLLSGSCPPSPRLATSPSSAASEGACEALGPCRARHAISRSTQPLGCSGKPSCRADCKSR